MLEIGIKVKSCRTSEKFLVYLAVERFEIRWRLTELLLHVDVHTVTAVEAECNRD